MTGQALRAAQLGSAAELKEVLDQDVSAQAQQDQNGATPTFDLASAGTGDATPCHSLPTMDHRPRLSGIQRP
jgi:hypothetical protein